MWLIIAFGFEIIRLSIPRTKRCGYINVIHLFLSHNTYAVTIPCEQNTGGMSLVEIGPRFVLKVIRIFEGSFGGPTLFQVTYCIFSVCARRMAEWLYILPHDVESDIC